MLKGAERTKCCLDTTENVGYTRKASVSFEDAVDMNATSRIRKTSLNTYRHLSTASSSATGTPFGLSPEKVPSSPFTFYEEILNEDSAAELHVNDVQLPRMMSNASPCLSDLSESLFNTSTEEEPIPPVPLVSSSPYKSTSSWKVPSNYEIMNIIGRGAYGEVAEAYDSKNNTRVAIKRMPNIFQVS